MPQLTNHCPSPFAPEPFDADTPLRELVCRHADALERLLEAHMYSSDPALARTFGSCAQSYRERGPVALSSWLYGMALRLLRESGITGASELPDFAGRFLQALPQALARPMITLALSGISYVACAIYLCRPASAPSADIALPDALHARLERSL